MQRCIKAINIIDSLLLTLEAKLGKIWVPKVRQVESASDEEMFAAFQLTAAVEFSKA